MFLRWKKNDKKVIKPFYCKVMSDVFFVPFILHLLPFHCAFYDIKILKNLHIFHFLQKKFQYACDDSKTHFSCYFKLFFGWKRDFIYLFGVMLGCYFLYSFYFTENKKYDTWDEVECIKFSRRVIVAPFQSPLYKNNK